MPFSKLFPTPRRAEQEIDWFNPPFPIECVIETGNICNLACPFCPTGIGQTGMKRGLMSLKTFRKVIDRLKNHVFCYEMMNWGEPFLNPDFLDMVRYLSKNGLRSNVDSNFCAFEFSDQFCEEIVRSGIWMISASIDGTTENTYSLYRREGNFDLAMANLKRLCRARDRLNSDSPIIHWQFLVHKNNEHEVENAKGIAEELQILLTFMPMDIWYETNELMKSSLHKLAEQGNYIREEWRYDFFRGYAKGNKYFEPTRKLFGFSPRFPTLPSGLPPVCFQPFARIVVNWDGQVLPCMHCYGDQFLIGDLTKGSLKQVWYNPQFKSCRNYLLNYGSPARKNSGSVCEKYPCSLIDK